MSDTGVTDESTQVTIERVGAVGLIAIDNPPVNAASHAVRRGISEALAALNGEDGVEVIALYGKGRTFIAGADIREFGRPPQPPILSALCTEIEASERPVVVLIHGTTLGGGLEVALGAHARAALAGTVLGFPEVTLGIIPGAGGTQRAPRLVGIKAALGLITTGRRIRAEEALALGLIDQVVEGEPREAALGLAQAVRTGATATRRTGTLDVVPDDDALDAARAAIAQKQPLLFAPHKAVDAVAASVGDLGEGLRTERALFEACLKSPKRAGLVHAFFAERAVTKIPEAEAAARPVDAIGVVGGGTMGSGIATAALLAGFNVVLVEREAAGLGRARDVVAANLDGAVSRGKLSDARRDTIRAGAFQGATDLAALGSVDMVIEAAFEDLAVKREIFAVLDIHAKPGAVLATNTSYLDINAIASATLRPQDVLGLHFFSPAHIMRLLEVVVTEETAADAVMTGFALAKRLGKVAVRAEVCDGFIGNRILSHFRKTAEYLVLDGAAPADVDKAMEAFGFAMGPFRVMDLAGLDISWAERKRRAPMRPAAERYSPVADQLCAAGHFGRKTGRGYYVYGGATGAPSPEAEAAIDNARAAAGITPGQFSNDEIVERCLTAMISEAARVVEDGTALRPIDVDAVYLFGYGFPRFRGGPLHYADTIGPREIIQTITRLAADDAHHWTVPPLLSELARDGKVFADIN